MPTFDTPEPIHATLDVVSGYVRISAGDRSDTVVDVRPNDELNPGDVQAAEQTKIEYANGHLLIRTPRNKIRSLLSRTPMVDVSVELPSDSRIDAKGWADIRSEGRLGESVFDNAAGSVRLDETGRLKLHAAAGDVSVGRSAGHTEVTTSSGKIRIGEVDGPAQVKTSNGDITVGEVTGDVRLKTANGDITVDRAGADVEARTAYGSVRVGEVRRGSVVLETRFGEVELGVGEGTAAWLDVNSTHGRVHSSLEASDGPAQSDQTVEVRARTGYGDILIRRS
jgi:DUF4097 and DUF4098 domain-containing protein YvlB